jgi:four helix bundle protein
VYRDLVVYGRARTLAGGVHACVSRWESFERWSVGIQAVRAADSIGANLAEGYGRAPSADRRRFVLIARGSAFELEHWLETAADRCLPLNPELIAESRQVSRMLNGLTRRMSRT